MRNAKTATTRFTNQNAAMISQTLKNRLLPIEPHAGHQKAFLLFWFPQSTVRASTKSGACARQFAVNSNHQIGIRGFGYHLNLAFIFENPAHRKTNERKNTLP
jgi:hypothetical protein